jgi:HD superfamily phosphohydrolase
MRAVLVATDASDLSLDSVFEMRESWWRYHLMQWVKSADEILSDLCLRTLNRVLFKTVRIKGENGAIFEKTKEAVRANGFDPEYYLHRVSTTDMLSSDYHQPMLVQMDDGTLIPVTAADPLLASLGKEALQVSREWLVMPEEAKLAVT